MFSSKMSIAVIFMTFIELVISGPDHHQCKKATSSLGLELGL